MCYMFKKSLSLFVLFALTLSFAGLKAETCYYPAEELSRVYSDAELAVLDSQTHVGSISFSKSIPETHQKSIKYEFLNSVQSKLINTAAHGSERDLLNIVNGNADLDFMTRFSDDPFENGCTLHQACVINSSKNCESLLKRGLSKHEFYLKALAAVWEYTQAGEYRGWTIGSIGGSPLELASVLSRSLEQFTAKYNSDSPGGKRLIEALKNADLKDDLSVRSSGAALLARHQAGLPVIVKTGYPGHSVSFILYKDYLIVGNRGENHHPHYPTVIYTINSKMLTAAIFEMIQGLDWQPSNYFVGFVGALPQLLGAAPNSMSDSVREIYRGDEWQKVGNCAFSSLEASLVGLWTLMSWEQSKNPHDFIANIRMWREFTKMQLLKDYIAAYMEDIDGLCPAQLRMLLARAKPLHTFTELNLQIQSEGQKLLAKAMYRFRNPNCPTATPEPKASKKTDPTPTATPKTSKKTDPTSENKRSTTPTPKNSKNKPREVKEVRKDINPPSSSKFDEKVVGPGVPEPLMRLFASGLAYLGQLRENLPSYVDMRQTAEEYLEGSYSRLQEIDVSYLKERYELLRSYSKEDIMDLWAMIVERGGLGSQKTDEPKSKTSRR